jgi:hypothetical protein
MESVARILAASPYRTQFNVIPLIQVPRLKRITSIAATGKIIEVQESPEYPILKAGHAIARFKP